MPPTTRSRGVPPPSRVYNSTTTPQQAQFPPRRKIIRTYGKQNRRTPAKKDPRQSTLTQLNFVSSFDEKEDPIVLSSDSEDMGDEEEPEVEQEEDDEDKENRPVKEAEDEVDEVDEQETEVEAEDDEENEEPVSSGRKRRSASKKAADDSRAKRRRTLGDSTGKKTKKKNAKTSRRKTMGDAPASSSSYHTQTLTQFNPHFLSRSSSGKGKAIQDSDDEDDGFQDWLQDPASPTPKAQPPRSPLKTLFERERTESRQSSVVPQTPSRPPRDEIPSSSQASTPRSTIVNHTGNPILQDPSSSKIYSSPSARPAVTPSKASTTTTSSPLSTLRSTMLNRYGPPNLHGSPSQRKASSLNTTPVVLKLTGKPKPKPGNTATPKLEIQDTFATESWGSGGATPTPKRVKLTQTPQRAKTPTRESSSLEEDEGEMETPTKPRQRRSSAELGDQRKRKTPTPRKMKKVSPHKSKKVMLEIPDSDEDDEGFDSEDDDGFVAGPETQFVMNEIASSEEEAAAMAPPSIPAPTPAVRALQELKSSSAMSAKPRRHATSSPPVPSSQPTSPAIPSSPPKTTSLTDTRVRLRKPLHQHSQAPLQTQPLESQRVPVTTLRALPSASFRSDILLPITPDVLASVTGGYEVNVVLPFKIPVQVVRFWLFDGEWLRYMACADAAEPEKGSWRYNLSQIYELNNPLEGSDMREEGWLEGNLEKYIYIPPAVVGQLLWNLRHALFKDGGEEETQGDELEPVSSPITKNPAPTPTPNLSVSQQVEAQLQSDIAQSTQFPTSDDILVPSTPEQEGTPTLKAVSKQPISPAKPPPPSHLTKPPTSYRASRPPLPRPSQATTASQASTPEKHSSHAQSTFYTRPSHHSSSSIVFESIGDSSPLRMPQSVPLGSSQLLTKSQMLPDSLLQDDARVPPEIWDSDEDADATL